MKSQVIALLVVLSLTQILPVLSVSEPIKSLLQTTARFALAQTKLPNHVNLDTAMIIIDEASTVLAKPSNLAQAFKLIGGALAAFFTITLIFPGAHLFFQDVWRNPAHTLYLDRYLARGISEKSVFEAINSTTDETLRHIGIHESSCREQSLCYTGQILKCAFPQTADTITKFASDNFSNTGFKDSRYGGAFLAGFVDRNCTQFSPTAARDDSGQSYSCLGNFITTLISGRNK